MDVGPVSAKTFMKTVFQFRKRLAHLAIGPLVGAIVAGLLLIILMLNINNDENSIGQTIGEKHASATVVLNAGRASCLQVV